jgi:hypothetical protein
MTVGPASVIVLGNDDGNDNDSVQRPASGVALRAPLYRYFNRRPSAR